MCFGNSSKRLGQSVEANTKVLEIEHICEADQTTMRVTVGDNLAHMKSAYAEGRANGDF